MFDLKNFCKDKFDQHRYSDRGIQELSEYVLMRLKQNNINHEYDQFIIDLEYIVDIFSSQRYELYSEQGLKKAKTFEVKNTITEYTGVVRTTEVQVRYVFGGFHTPEYIDCFPQRLKPYYNPSQDIIEGQLIHFIKFGTKHVAELGSEFVTIFENIKTKFTTNKGEQQNVKSEITDDVVQKKSQRKTLTILLSAILFYLSSKNIDKYENVKKIFKLSILTKHQKHNKNRVTIIGTVEANETAMIYNKVRVNSKFIFKNNSSVSLLFCISNNAESACIKGIIVAPDKRIEKTFKEIGLKGNRILKVTNPSVDTDANYNVEIIN